MPEYLDRSSKNAKGYLLPRSISGDQPLGINIPEPDMVGEQTAGEKPREVSSEKSGWLGRGDGFGSGHDFF
jgi:hypothetical protein